MCLNDRHLRNIWRVFRQRNPLGTHLHMFWYLGHQMCWLVCLDRLEHRFSIRCRQRAYRLRTGLHRLRHQSMYSHNSFMDMSRHIFLSYHPSISEHLHCVYWVVDILADIVCYILQLLPMCLSDSRVPPHMYRCHFSHMLGLDQQNMSPHISWAVDQQMIPYRSKWCSPYIHHGIRECHSNQIFQMGTEPHKVFYRDLRNFWVR